MVLKKGWSGLVLGRKTLIFCYALYEVALAAAEAVNTSS